MATPRHACVTEIHQSVYADTRPTRSIVASRRLEENGFTQAHRFKAEEVALAERYLRRYPEPHA